MGGAVTTSGKAISMKEVAKHSTKDDCWCAIHGKVYNLTSFLSDHPGGSRIIVKYAGKDATAAFDASGHPKDIVAQLGLEHLCLGDVAGHVAASNGNEAALKTWEASVAGNPPLDHIVNLFDFEAVAQRCMQKQGVRHLARRTCLAMPVHEPNVDAPSKQSTCF